MNESPVRAGRSAAIAAVTAVVLALSGCISLPAARKSTEPAATAAESAAVPVEYEAEPVVPAAVAPAAAAADPVPEESVAGDEGPQDLLARIRSQFALPEVADESVTREADWYASHPDYLDRVFGRASSYLHFIAESIEERGMPLDIALLPIVESAFDPFAYSHGRASGLWQIIPGTGQHLGLKQNWWFDGRRDIADSTRAALDYLEALHEQFDGDWLLAVAGYNSGEGNVARAIRRAERAGRPTDFFSIRGDLPAETRTYVPRLLAIRNLVATPEQFGLELPVIADEPVFAAVDIGSQLDMTLAAELAGLDVDTLYAFNPGINRWATDPEGPHRLLVPVDSAAALRTGLASVGADDRVRWTRHRVRNGETLGQIALQYSTTVDALQDTNNLRGTLIRAGDYLMIPHAAAAADAYSQSMDERAMRRRNADRPGRRIDHRVGAGESFWSISQRYGVGVRELAAWNSMAPGDTLPVGRALVVWTDADVAAAPLAAGGQSRVREVNYTVRRGDSLASIARRFRVTVANLVEWNRIDPARYLQPGQRLVMHVDVTEQSS